MGGAQKHMLHPYDDLDLTFGDWFRIAHDIYRGGSFCEKLDGCNLTWRFDGDEFLVARNWKHFRSGGQRVSDYRKYLDGHPAEKQFTKALDNLEALRPHLIALEYYERLGDDVWVNMEIIDKDSPQMLRYDVDTFAIHNLCRFVDGKRPHVVNIEHDYVPLERWAKILSLSGVNVIHRAMVSIPEVSDYYWTWVDKMGHLLQDLGLGLGDTLRNYVFRKVVLELGEQTSASFDVITKLAENVAGIGKHKIKVLREGLSPSDLECVNKIALSANKQKTINRNLRLVKDLWLWFGAQRLEGISSTLVLDNNSCQSRIDQLIQWNILQCGDVFVETHRYLYDALCLQLDRFEALDVSPQTIEGFVIEHKGKLYKLTGAFQSLNRICGVARYQLGVKFPEPI